MVSCRIEKDASRRHAGGRGESDSLLTEHQHVKATSFVQCTVGHLSEKPTGRHASVNWATRVGLYLYSLDQKTIVCYSLGHASAAILIRL